MPRDMISITPKNAFKKLSKQMKLTPDLLNKALKKELNKTSTVVKNKMKLEVPGKPSYPLDWQSEKQRRFVMAKLSEEGNLPYSRTNEIVNAWRFRVIANKGLDIRVEMTNKSPQARYVIGDDQQRMHKKTGWRHAFDSFSDHTPLYFEAIQRAYFSVVNFDTDK